jgi:crossover junction endodeoxyribonuclease RuvC
VIVTGLDISLTGTGVCVIDHTSITLRCIESKPPKTERNPRTGKPLPPTLDQRALRLAELSMEISASVPTSCNLVVIEQPAYSRNEGAAHDRSGLWWLVAQFLFVRDIPFVEVPPNARILYALGTGRGNKDQVMLETAERYRHLVKVTGNNEADALVIAAMGARHLGHPIENSLPQKHIKAMASVRWPAREAAA